MIAPSDVVLECACGTQKGTAEKAVPFALCGPQRTTLSFLHHHLQG